MQDAGPEQETGAPLERPYETHVFVCTFGPWCPRDGPAHAILSLLKNAMKDAGLRDVVRVNRAGCLNQCGNGPMAVVYPEGTWYSKLDLDAARRIADEHLVAGRIVEEHRFKPAQRGNNKLPHIRALDAAKKAAKSQAVTPPMDAPEVPTREPAPDAERSQPKRQS